MTEVEQFYYATQKKLGGNIPWSSINPEQQHLLILFYKLFLEKDKS